MDDKTKKRNAERATEQPGSMSSYNNRPGNREGRVEEATGDKSDRSENSDADSRLEEKPTSQAEERKS